MYFLGNSDDNVILSVYSSRDKQNKWKSFSLLESGRWEAPWHTINLVHNKN